MTKKESTSGTVQVLGVESSVLRCHSTWRAGGVNAKVAGSVSEDRSLFGATDKEGSGSWTSIGRRGRLGICVLGRSRR